MDHYGIFAHPMLLPFIKKKCISTLLGFVTVKRVQMPIPDSGEFFLPYIWWLHGYCMDKKGLL